MSPHRHTRCRATRTRARPSSKGFTLLEVMLALLALAILAGLAWQGIATLVRTREHVQTQLDLAHSRDAALTQWRTDWQRLWSEPLGVSLPASLWDGQSLLMLRQAPVQHPWQDPGLQVVAWTLRDQQWWRWASTPVTQQAPLLQAWEQASLWIQQGQSQTQAVALMPAQSWRLLYYRGGAWVNPASDASETNPSAVPTVPAAPTAPTGPTAPPDAVRLELQLAPGQRLQVDVANPSLALERP